MHSLQSYEMLLQEDVSDPSLEIDVEQDGTLAEGRSRRLLLFLLASCLTNVVLLASWLTNSCNTCDSHNSPQLLYSPAQDAIE
ncbi:hypothetical protein WG66_011883 [Moniliophthora roreri]|nr:hypothetical protein WG66_011883 [Moniliophthora roreri]